MVNTDDREETMISLTINNTQVEVPEGTTILTAASKCGINIPTLCYVENTVPKGACRVCVVEVEGARTLMAACSTPVTEGMVVKTNTKRAREARRLVVELLLSEHNGNCQTCGRNNDCELQELAREMGILEVKWEGERLESQIDESTAALVRDSG
jgi:NADH dehydrogenase/NADH:ubiquinone oxidoreductase subunit G